MNEMRKLMEEIDSIEEVEEGIFGKKDRSIGEIGAELADRSTVRSAASYAVEFAGNPDRFLELGPEEQKSVWDTMKTVVLPVWEDQQRG
jgi:hypothetical protein